MPLVSRVAKLALDNPEMRDGLVPILRSAREFTKKEWETYLEKHPNADKSKHTITDADEPKGKDEDKGKGKSKEEVKKEVEDKDIEVKPPADEDALVEFSGEIPEYHLEIIAGGEGGEITEADLRRAKAVKAQLKRGIEAAADVCKMSPPVCEGNLGVYRESMPQLSADEPVKKMLWSDDERIEDNNGGKGFATKNTGWKKVPWDQLSEADQASLKKDWAAARKKGQAAVDAGADPDDDRTVFQQLLDGLADEGVTIGSQEPPYERVDVGKLKATQREIKAGKTFGMADSYFSGQYDPSKAPIIISSDNHILDGHHRYSAMITADPDAKMNVIRVDMPMRDFLERSFRQPGVFRADLQDNVIDSSKPLDLSREPGSTWQQPGNDGYYAKNKEGETGGPFKSEKAAKDFASGKKSKGKKAGYEGHHHKGTDGRWYADTAFLNAVGRVPGVRLEHMGFGEFYADTPKGRVDFDRMRGRDFDGQSGRSHQVYGAGAEWLIAQMERGNHSERVAAAVHRATSKSLRTAAIWLAAENIGPLSEALLPIINGSVRTAGKVTIRLDRGHLAVEDIEGMSPMGKVGQVAHLNDRASGAKAARAAMQVANEHKRELEAMTSGDRAVGFIEQKVYEMTGKHLRWQYIQLPM